MPNPAKLILAAALAAVFPALAATPAAADVVKLAAGDVLTGTVVSQDESNVVLDSPVLGRLFLPRRDVAEVTVGQAIVPTAPAAPSTQPTTQPATQPTTRQAETVPPEGIAVAPGNTVGPAVKNEPKGLFGTPLLKGFAKQAEAGFSGASGNQETLNFYGKFGANYADKSDRWLIDVAYFYSTVNGQMSRSQGHAEVTKDWLFPDSPWFVFTKTRYDYDAFGDWRSRASVFVGPGYEFFKTDKFTLVGRLGLGGSYEWDGDHPAGLKPEGLVGLEGTYKFTERQAISFSSTLFPVLDEFGQSRNTSTLAYTYKMTEKLSLKLGLENNYASKTEGDAEHNDLKYFGAIAYSF